MNCKQGDIAVIVRSKFGHEGKIVKCLDRFDGPWADGSYEAGWLIDTPLLKNGQFWFYQTDASMRPIRPSEGQDETLSWKDVPQGEIA